MLKSSSLSFTIVTQKRQSVHSPTSALFTTVQLNAIYYNFVGTLAVPEAADLPQSVKVIYSEIRGAA
jgi:hypothetical protein